MRALKFDVIKSEARSLAKPVEADLRLVTLFPEVARNEMSLLENGEDCVLQLFIGPPHVVSLANVTANPIVVMLKMHAATRLVDRRTGHELVTESESANIPLESWQFLAFELRISGPLLSKPVRILRTLLRLATPKTTNE